MLTRTFVAAALTLLQGVVLALLAAGGAWLMRTINARVKNRTASEALQLVTATVAAGVASAYQTTVADLKDETKPGTWTAAIGQSLKRQVVDNAKRLAPEAVARLAATGLDPARLEVLLGQLVEQEVLKLKATAPVALTAARLDTVTPEAPAPTAAAAAAPAPAPSPAAGAGAAFGAAAGLDVEPSVPAWTGPVAR